MPTFAFTARDAQGREQAGVQSADNAASLASALRGRGWIVTALEAAAEAGDAGANTAAAGAHSRAGVLPPTHFDVEFGLRQIAAMLRSGITLLSALRTAAEQARRPRMAAVWLRVRDRVQEGSSFADALAEHPKRFPPLVTQLARTGEQSGTLEIVLERAADQLERRRALRATMLSALAYPSIVLVLALGVAGFMVLKVIPVMQKFLSSRGRRLPAITQALIDVSNWLQNWLPWLALGLLVALTATILLYRFPPARLAMDRAVLRVPLFGRVFRIAATAMFARGLSLLLDNGVTLLDALRTASGLMGNAALARRVEQAREAVLAGAPLARPLAHPGEFMPMLSRMTTVGEETGTLGRVLEETARFHEQQLAAWVRWLSMLVEPVVVVTVGGIVGFVYIAFFAALFSLSGGGR